jgi:hypothetical protein
VCFYGPGNEFVGLYKTRELHQMSNNQGRTVTFEKVDEDYRRPQFHVELWRLTLPGIHTESERN